MSLHVSFLFVIKLLPFPYQCICGPSCSPTSFPPLFVLSFHSADIRLSVRPDVLTLGWLLAGGNPMAPPSTAGRDSFSRRPPHLKIFTRRWAVMSAPGRRLMTGRETGCRERSVHVRRIAKRLGRAGGRVVKRTGDHESGWSIVYARWLMLARVSEWAGGAMMMLLLPLLLMLVEWLTSSCYNTALTKWRWILLLDTQRNKFKFVEFQCRPQHECDNRLALDVTRSPYLILVNSQQSGYRNTIPNTRHDHVHVTMHARYHVCLAYWPSLT